MKRCDCGCMEVGKDAKAQQDRETPEARETRKGQPEEPRKESPKTKER